MQFLHDKVNSTNTGHTMHGALNKLFDIIWNGVIWFQCACALSIECNVNEQKS